jgi:hypothetical protein
MDRMISSAHRTASEIAATVAGTLLPPSYWASFRAANMLAAINNTRLRPSSTSKSVALSPYIRPWADIRFFEGEGGSGLMPRKQKIDREKVMARWIRPALNAA